MAVVVHAVLKQLGELGEKRLVLRCLQIIASLHVLHLLHYITRNSLLELRTLYIKLVQRPRLCRLCPSEGWTRRPLSDREGDMIGGQRPG